MSNSLYSTSQHHNVVRVKLHLQDGSREISQSEETAAFHSAVNDGARFFNLPYFPIKPFPGLWGQADRFPAVSEESRRYYRGSCSQDEQETARRPATVCGRDGRPAATAAADDH
jgi:hypothetical protein